MISNLISRLKILLTEDIHLLEIDRMLRMCIYYSRFEKDRKRHTCYLISACSEKVRKDVSLVTIISGGEITKPRDLRSYIECCSMKYKKEGDSDELLYQVKI